MDKALQVRRYKPTDRKQVYLVHKIALSQAGTYIKGKWDDDFKSVEETYLKDGEFLVGEYKGKIVAMGGLRRKDNDVGEIKRMRVLPKYQGRGFGQKILTLLENRARELGYKKLILDTTVKQPVAQNLYLKNGYKEVRRGTINVLNIENIYYDKNL